VRERHRQRQTDGTAARNQNRNLLGIHENH
jgi:hypothetical protein